MEEAADAGTVPTVADREATPGTDPPYRGLAAYQAEDARLFFGRDRLVAELIERVANGRFLAVFGPSGSGKSSLLRAGLVAAARAGRMPDAGGREWPTIVMTPGERPLVELRSRLGDRAALADQPEQAPLLVVVDQFEEAFTLCRDGAEREAFIAASMALADAADIRTRVVIGVRADFFAACVSHPGLAEAMRDRQLLVTPMTATEVREAVARPAESAGLMVEGALVSTIVAEVTGQAGGLPLASHVLLEAWRRRRGNALTVSGYEAAARLPRAALDLWQGEPIAGAEGAFVAPARAGLLDRRLGILEEVTGVELELGQHAAVVAELAAAAAAHPLSEVLQARLVLALHRCGRTAEALAAIRGYRRLLAEQVGIDAGADLLALELAMLRADPGLRPRAHLQPDRWRRGRRRRSILRPEASR